MTDKSTSSLSSNSQKDTATIKTSRDYAKKLRELADFLDNRPEFPLPDYSDLHYRSRGIETLRYYSEKAPFLAAVKAVGTVTKCADGSDFMLVAANGLLQLCASRESVCRLVKPAQEAVYECEPLLSQAEEAAIGGTL